MLSVLSNLSTCMFKRTFIGIFVLAGVFSMSVAPTSALAGGEIQAQIQSLLSQVAAWGASTAQSTTVIASPSRAHRVCVSLYRNLSIGVRGDDVVALQEFLRAEGYLSANATGYFGPATRAALARWQASQGISAVGSLGPITRARIAAWCGYSGGGGGPIACTKEYKPVCGAKPIVCITAPCNPIQQTYSNRCMMASDGATYLYEGECRADWSNPADDPRCSAWYDGCNSCSRQYPGAPAMCTLRACIGGETKPYCTAWFDAPTNRPPVISGFSGPTALSINQMGSWSVQASDPENGPLSYSINWGDEMYAAPMASYAAESFVQTTTFTHAYARAGTYTVTVSVRDSSGQQAQTTSTVRVEGGVGYCTMEYAPVCGQPPEPACRYTQPYCMLPTPAPQTYGNRCMLNAAGATFLYEGACRNY